MKKMFFGLFIFAAVIAARPLPAQDLEYRKAPLIIAPAKFDTLLDYTMDDYKLYLFLPMYNDSIYGRAAISMCTNVGRVNVFSLNCEGLVVDSVFKLGAPITFNQSGGILNLDINQNAAGCFNLDIFYRGGNFVRGFNYYPQGSGQPHTMAYTMSEPQDARYWMPCIDEPFAKATYGCEFHVSVPDSFKVAANGFLVDTTRSGDTLTWFWKEENRIATYLMSFAVSNFAFWSDTAYPADGDTIPLNYFVWPEDSVQATAVFDSVPVMLDCFTEKFGPYPFVKYGMAAAYPFAYGGMEHQDMTTIHRSWITNNSQRGIAHELAHMWWGDEVTCGYWADIWLNEGFASYSEAIYDEYKSGRSPGIYMQQRFWKALYAQGYPIYNPPAESLFSWSMEYAKGAWVLHSLRWVMGDATFFPMLRAYSDSFEYKNAVTSEFQRIAEQHYGLPLQWYFDQWVYRAGHPTYTTVVYYKTHPDSNSAQVKIKQTSTTGELYTMPLALACSTSAGIDSTIVVWNDLAVQEFQVYDDQPVLGVKLDPDNWVLKEVYDSLPELSFLNTAVKYGGSLINVYWYKFLADSGCAGFNVYRSENPGGPFARINVDVVADTSYSDTTTYGGTEYFYAITAVSSSDTSYETRQSNVLSLVAGGVEGNPGDSELITGNGLLQNSPNPFKQSTVINYQLAKPGEVSLKVYNISGQLVKTLAQGVQGAGRYTVTWNGRGHDGQKVSSGVYICRLSVGEKCFVKKMQFIR
jgi:aminopeptidase N